jgi:hypothetical protein
MATRTEIKGHFIHPGLGACGGLFIREDEGSYYNGITTLNYPPNYRVYSKEGNLDYYIT